MLGVLENIFSTRTDNDRRGTISQEWNRILLWRDLERFIAEGLVERVECKTVSEADFRERQCFRETETGEIYVFIEGWERGCPEFRKQIADE
jgi:hypothetical protein